MTVEQKIEAIEKDLKYMMMVIEGMEGTIRQTDFLIKEALFTDGAHHKQWFIEKIAEAIGINLEGIPFEKGISP